MDNLAYDDSIMDELLDGKIVLMSPRPSLNHNRAATNISAIFTNYLQNKPCEYFGDGVDVYLTENDRVIPDGMVVCNENIMKSDGIYGSPALIIEILSPSTAKNDKGYKKELYEKTGVKEYWIVNTADRSIEVYLLDNGKYKLDNIYTIFPDYMIKKMTEEEKAQIITEFKTSLYDDLVISLDKVFKKIV